MNTLTQAKTVQPTKATIQKTLTQATTVRPTKATIKTTHSLKQQQYSQLIKATVQKTAQPTKVTIKRDTLTQASRVLAGS